MKHIQYFLTIKLIGWYKKDKDIQNKFKVTQQPEKGFQQLHSSSTYIKAWFEEENNKLHHYL